MSSLTEKLRLVYLGNLGLVHDVPLLCEFLAACGERTAVELCFVGTAERSLASLQKFAGQHRITITWHPAVAFERLAEVLLPMNFDYGLVTLNERFLGLLSPSKFSGYLAAGLPVIYLGPAGTNAAVICDELAAGLRLTREMLQGSGKPPALDRVFSEKSKAAMRAKIEYAIRYFARYDGQFLADEILRRVGPITTS